MGPRWTFRQYVTDWGEWPFRAWYQAQDAHVRAGFDVTIKTLTATDDWDGLTEFKKLSGLHAPLSELRYRADDTDRRGRVIKRRRIRPIGLIRPELFDFILLGGAEEIRNGGYDPPNAFGKALRLLDNLQRGKGELYELD